VDTFFQDREYYTWIETGFRLGAGTNPGEKVHVNVWHQDPRVEAGVEESWGMTFSASTVLANRWTPFLRAGYSEGDAAKVRFILLGGVGLRVRGSDFLGVATSWSGPTDPTLRNQMTFEALYRLQLTENMTLTPDLQFTIHPSLTLDRDVLAVFGVLRLRIALYPG
jgi:porin